MELCPVWGRWVNPWCLLLLVWSSGNFYEKTVSSWLTEWYFLSHVPRVLEKGSRGPEVGADLTWRSRGWVFPELPICAWLCCRWKYHVHGLLSCEPPRSDTIRTKVELSLPPSIDGICTCLACKRNFPENPVEVVPTLYWSIHKTPVPTSSCSVVW